MSAMSEALATAQQIHLGNGLCTCYGREHPGVPCRVHRQIARALIEQARTIRLAAAQIASNLALGWAATQPTGALHACRVAVAEARRGRARQGLLMVGTRRACL